MLSQKYKHGDIVINVHEDPLGLVPPEIDLGKVLVGHNIVSKRVRREYDKCISVVRDSKVPQVICDWFVIDNDITYIDESQVRLATPAEMLLYGPAHIKKNRRNRRKK